MVNYYFGCGINTPPPYQYFFEQWIPVGSGINYVPIFRIPGDINSGVASTNVYAQAPGENYPGDFLFNKASINGGYFEDEYFCAPKPRWDNVNCICIDTTSEESYPGKYESEAACLSDPCGGGDVNFIDLVVPVFSGNCDSSGNPTFNNQTVSVIEGTQSAELLKFQELARLQGFQACHIDIPACPDGWLLRPEYARPQAIYQFAQIDGGGNVIGSPCYKMTIPHHLSAKPTSPPPNYVRGNWEFIYVLKDNSKITFHTVDESTSTNLLDHFLPLIDPAYLVGAYLSKSAIAVREIPIQQFPVRCNYAKFYATGVKTGVPTWRVKF
jgi:hypothetical protein